MQCAFWVHWALGETCGEQCSSLVSVCLNDFSYLPPYRPTLGLSDSKELDLILLYMYPFYLDFTKYSWRGGEG